MDIDFSHTNASWAYSGFHRFRVNLAKEAGVDLEKMEGFGGDISWDTIQDEIKPFLNHSDCEGELTPDECNTIAPRLRQLVQSWPDDWYDKKKALELADGMNEAFLAGENLEFR